MKPTEKIAVIDIGSNTLRLVIGYLEDGKIQRLFADRIITKLGKDLKFTKNLNFEAQKKSLEALIKFKSISEDFNANYLIPIGTSALREADNSSNFIESVSKFTGLDIRILTGEQEAHYTLEGIKLGLNNIENFIAIDIGGGSTEWIFSDKGEIFKGSLNIGVLKFLNNKNYMSQENLITYLKYYINNLIKSNLPKKNFKNLIATGGTAVTVGMIDLKINNYIPDLIHGQIISKNKLKLIAQKIYKTNVEERKKMIGIPPDRLDIILPGIIILECLLDYFSCNSLIISDFGLIEGIMKNYRDFVIINDYEFKKSIF